jgi:uncharacterized glyoxalase superfamily protein PhnB
MLAVRDAAAAVDFYVSAFGATERWRIDAGGAIVAGLVVGDAELFLAEENPPSTSGPTTAGTTTVRIELFVDDPEFVRARAIAAGATPGPPVTRHRHETVGGAPFEMLQGGVVDPFGHVWLIGRFL